MKIKLLYYIALCLSAVLLVGGSYSTSVASEIESERSIIKYRQELERIKEEINNYKQQIEKQESNEISVSKQLYNIGRKIDLQENLLQKIAVGEKNINKQIDETQRAIEKRRAELDNLQAGLSSRLEHLYKHGRLNELEILLRSESLSQALVRLKYFKLIIHHDMENIETVKSLIGDYEQDREQLMESLEEQRKMRIEKQNETRRLEEQKKQRGKILTDLKKDKSKYQVLLKEKIEAQKTLEKTIADIIKTTTKEKSLSRNYPIPKGIPFRKLKGRLLWPTEGYVIKKYGLNHNPELKTTIRNNGIDIKARLGENVSAVADGVVWDIRWFRLGGNILFLRHTDGFFTVYAHLSEIKVELGQEIEAGKIIARVGDTGSFDGAKLHFEIWKEKKTYDPEKWLINRRIALR